MGKNNREKRKEVIIPLSDSTSITYSEDRIARTAQQMGFELQIYIVNRANELMVLLVE